MKTSTLLSAASIIAGGRKYKILLTGLTFIYMGYKSLKGKGKKAK